MTDDTYHTKFSGEVRIACKLSVVSYEVWINNQFLINADSYAKALAFLSDYLHIKAGDELSKHILETELMKQIYMPKLAYTKKE